MLKIKKKRFCKKLCNQIDLSEGDLKNYHFKNQNSIIGYSSKDNLFL